VGAPLALASVLLGAAARGLVAGRRWRDAVYRLGDWPAPFGIVLVVDRLAR
jgi:multicomponent K+:H+ antiporter subunit D